MAKKDPYGAFKFTPMQAPTLAAPQALGPNKAFELQRQQLGQRLSQDASTQQEALNRRFAAMGGGPAGASIKAMQNLGEQQARVREEAMGGISAQEAQDEARRNEILQQQNLENARLQAQMGMDIGRYNQETAFQRAMAKQQLKQQLDEAAFNKAMGIGELGSGSRYQKFAQLYKKFGGSKLPGTSQSAISRRQQMRDQYNPSLGGKTDAQGNFTYG